MALVSEILHINLDKSKPTIAVFLDIAKAFDCVTLDIFLERAEQMGDRGKEKKLFGSYMSCRKQRVKINNTYSSYRDLKYGVPQGSKLGPLFFILFVNTFVQLCRAVAFADDTMIICEGENWLQAKRNVENALREIYIWLATNALKLNIDKTKFMTFGNYYDSVPTNIEIKIHNCLNEKNCDCPLIERTESIKYLGIYIDYNLKWKMHLQSLVNNNRYLLYTFYKIRSLLKKEHKLQLYSALFTSKIFDGIIAWGGCDKTALKSLNGLQSRLHRILALKGTNHFTVKQKFIYESLLFKFAELKNIWINSESITRNKSIALPKCKLKVGKKCHNFAAIGSFNGLPESIKTTTVKNNTFKKKVKEWILKMF